MNIDFHLRNGVIGRLGSFWSRQVDSGTRDKATELSRISGLSGELVKLDVAAGYCVSRDGTLIYDATFTFVDGVYANVGQDLQAYDYAALGAVVEALRDPSHPGRSASEVPREHPMAGDLELGSSVAGDLSAGADWYLLPVPAGLFPITITTRYPGVRLVSGIDFVAFDGFIALRDNPAEILVPGIVVAPSAWRIPQVAHSYTLQAAFERSGNLHVAAYQKRSHALPAFRRAAAEYCGMWVLEVDDMPLRAMPAPSGTLYLMASSGPRLVDYDHDALKVGTSYPAGHVVGPLFKIGPPPWGASSAPVTDDPQEYHLAGIDGAVFSLDGLLPVKGLSWDSSLSVPASYSGASTGDMLHAVFDFIGAGPAASRMALMQKHHELHTRLPLAAELDINDIAATRYVDFGAILRDYYGDLLIVCVFGPMPDMMRVRLDEFLAENKPTGCVLLVAHDHVMV